MLDNRWYYKLTATQLKGRKVRTKSEIHTSSISVRKGIVLTIIGKQGGLKLEGPSCPFCGVTVLLIKVHPSYVELLAEWDTGILTCCGMQVLADGSGCCGNRPPHLRT